MSKDTYISIDDLSGEPAFQDTIWIMRTEKGWYPIQPTSRCKPEEHGALNPHVTSIEDAEGNVLWRRQ
jgi:hypothetical protein